MQTLEKTEPKLADLKARLIEIDDIDSAAALLYWDQVTYMPPAGATARGRQLATLHQLAHQKFTDDTIGNLLEDLKPYEASLSYDSDEASLIRVARRNYDREICVPARFMAKLSQHRTEAYAAWAEARATHCFPLVEPYLEKTLELSRELANFYPGYEHIADPLIDRADEGMKASTIQELFSALRQELVPIVDAISNQPLADDSCVHQFFPEAEQLDFSLQTIARMGYDLERGRQDQTLHPFMTNFSVNDVRITTRVCENDLNETLFSSIHEMGHALYEQGVNPAFEGTSLGGGTSSGTHESQSRLWENLVARSRPFWFYLYPQLQTAFPEQLKEIPLDTFYRAINKVHRSLIRTDADEVTYNLHVMIRFDLELAMLEGKLAVRDLPEAWNERYRSDLGVVPTSDSNGVLQDVHWYSGTVGGMFQCYTLGNLMSAQFFETALKAIPAIPEQIARGDFQPLHNWLQSNIYCHGRKYTAEELLERVTGSPLSIEPLLRHIRSKYGELYAL